VLSRHWPVYSSETDDEGRSRQLRPEEALDIARAEATRLLRLRLVGKPVDFDPLTDFVLLAWSIFAARAFPFDEARRLALATGGLDVNELERHKVLRAKSGTVTLLAPHERRRSETREEELAGDGLFDTHDPQARGLGEQLAGVRRFRHRFAYVIDAVHTALYISAEDGLGAAKRWLDDRELSDDSRFTDCLQALVNAMPRSKTNRKWNVEEARLLDELVRTYFPDIEIPEAPAVVEEQTLDLGV